MIQYGMPFFLEDRTGDLGGSEYVDLYNRLRLTVRCTLRDSHRTAYMVHDASTPATPIAFLDFGHGGALGSIKVGSGPGEGVGMQEFLVKAGSKTRKFVASDGQEYRWTHQAGGDVEWTCVNTKGYHVASYSLKPADEPQYTGSSGCMLTVEESYPHIVGELLATLIIMRHIAKYNL